MIERWALILAGPGMILGALALWRGWLPAGAERRARVWHLVYDNPDHPYNRLVIAPLLFGGIGTVLVALASELRPAGPGLTWVAVSAALLALVAYGYAAWTWFHLPSWSIPAWVREELRRREAGLPSGLEVPPGGKQLTMSRREFVLGWLLSGVGLVGVLFFDWPPAVLFGVGTWMSLVAIAKIRRRPRFAHRSHEVYANDIYNGIRPAFEVRSKLSADQWVVTIDELAQLRGLAPTERDVDFVARIMIAKALDVPSDSFDLVKRDHALR